MLETKESCTNYALHLCLSRYLEALVVSSTTAVVLGKLDNNLRSVHNVTVELVNSLLSIAGIL